MHDDRHGRSLRGMRLFHRETVSCCMRGEEKAREVEEGWARWGMVVQSPSCLQLLVLEQARVGL